MMVLTKEEVVRLLKEKGITVPEEDIPFLERSLLRQRDLIGRLDDRLGRETEPAHVFKPV